MTPLSPRAVLFDLDGTLIDSAPSLHVSVCAMLDGLALPQPDLATVTGFVGNGVPTLVARCLHWAGADPALQDAALARFTAIYNADPVNGVTVFPGVRDTLAALDARGIAMGLCTNKPEAPARQVVNALKLGPFATIVGGDTLPNRKPDPAPLSHALAQLGCMANEALFVGDSAVDCATAQAAGLPYIHLSWGYAHTPLPDTAPRVELSNVAELLGLLTQK